MYSIRRRRVNSHRGEGNLPHRHFMLPGLGIRLSYPESDIQRYPSLSELLLLEEGVRLGEQLTKRVSTIDFPL